MEKEILYGAVHLRTLTKKSRLDFGQYKELTVMDVMNLRKNNYLRWAYYANSMISFTDEILAEIGILDNEKIEKPGCDLQMLEKYKENHQQKGLGRHISKLKSKKIQKAKLARFVVRDKKYNSKGNMQSRNHGH